MSIRKFPKKSPQEQPQELQYSDVLADTQRNLARGRKIFSFLSRAARQFMEDRTPLSPDELGGYDWCVVTANAELETAYELLEIQLTALRGGKADE